MKNAVIVGYGMIGPVHAKAIKNLETVNLYGVCDTDAEKCRAFSEEYGGKIFSDFKEVLTDGNVDSVHICTPHYLHYEMAREALCAGKSVVLEKPATMKKEEFDALLKEFKNPPVCVMFQNRLNNCVVKMKEIISTEDMGELKAVKGILTWHRDKAYYNSGSWRGTALYEGGGVLINQAIHTVDLMSYLTGGIKSVSATLRNSSLKGVIEVEDTAESFMRLKNGGTGVFYATNAYGTNSSVFVELLFEKGTLTYNNKTLIRNGEIIATDNAPVMGKPYWGSGHMGVLDDFYRGTNNFGLKSVENSMNAVFAMYESAKENGKEVFI